MSIASGAGTAPTRSQRGPRPGRSAPIARATATGGLLLAVLAGGCRESTTREASLEMPEPRTSGGVFLTEDDPVRLSEIAAALDAMGWEGSPSAGRIVTLPTASLPVAFPEGAADLPQAPDMAAADPADAPQDAAGGEGDPAPAADPPPGEPSGGRRWSSPAST